MCFCSLYPYPIKDTFQKILKFKFKKVIRLVTRPFRYPYPIPCNIASNNAKYTIKRQETSVKHVKGKENNKLQ